jgi:site-specific DNA-methyltransferase (adenine-specific)
MLNKLNPYKKFTIFSNSNLQAFFLNLENKYNISYKENDFAKLVNFSQNKNIAFHKWFSYREGFAGELIDKILSISSAKKGEVILDPFCGSGTTLVSSVMNGYVAIGIDINPMSVSISNVKTQKFNSSSLIEIYERIKQLPQDINNINLKIIPDKYSKYFKPTIYEQLKKIDSYIANIISHEVKDVFHTAFLCIIEEVSDRKRDGNGLKVSFSKVTDAVNFFISKVITITNDIEKALPYLKEKSFCLQGSATEMGSKVSSLLSKTNNKIGAIIFSPPYANSFDYFESYKLELALGGFLNDEVTLKSLRKKAIYSFVGGNDEHLSDENDYVELLANEILLAIPEKEKKTGKIDQRTRKVPNMIKGYFRDMFKVIDECGYLLKSKKEVYIVVDQNSYLGKVIPTDLLFAFHAEKVGFKVKEIIVTRPSKTSSQQLKAYPYLKETLRESIVVLEKS